MKILCVLVLYNQKLESSLAYLSLVKDNLQRNDFYLFIYDNSQFPQYSQSDFDINKIAYISDPNNSGLSVAYNRAGEFARLNGYSWMLLLDQDTTIINEDYIDIFIKKLDSIYNVALFAPKVISNQGMIMSPLKLFFRIPIKSKIKPNSINRITNIGIINSGMFINVDAFWKVGGYKNEVFLDYADYQFIERYSKKYESFFFLDATLLQDFSNSEVDIYKLEKRYKSFCRSLSFFDKKNIWDKFNIFFIVLKRGISLSFRTKKMSFFKILFKYYKS